jgi:hypothetical protein
MRLATTPISADDLRAKAPRASAYRSFTNPKGRSTPAVLSRLGRTRGSRQQEARGSWARPGVRGGIDRERAEKVGPLQPQYS